MLGDRYYLNNDIDDGQKVDGETGETRLCYCSETLMKVLFVGLRWSSYR